MWCHQEVANHPVVVRPQGVCSLVHLAPTFWFQAATPVLTVLQRMYVFVLHIVKVPHEFTGSPCCTSQSYLYCDNNMVNGEEFLYPSLRNSMKQML
jgi:hypothetical protein